MAYLQEVNGKMRMRTMMIGDGVDKMHSPLQVEPQMATDMLNLSSELYPSLKTRNGRQQLSLNYHDYTIASSTVLGFIKPFCDSVGNLHYGIAYKSVPDIGMEMDWYFIANGTNYCQKLKSHMLISESSSPRNDGQYYLNVNFFESMGKVYITYLRSARWTAFMYYHIPTSDIYKVFLEIPDSLYVSPSCTYLNKMFLMAGYPEQRITGGIASNYYLYFSATGNFEDFDTALNSGYVYITQGGAVTSLIPMQDRLFIGCEKALFLLFGNTVDSFSLTLLADNIGVKNNKCITQRNGIVYFVSNNNEIYEYNGSTLLNLTREPIETGSRSGVKGGFPDNLLSFTSISVDNSYLRCVGTSYVYVFDLVKRRWYIEDLVSSVVDKDVFTFNSLLKSYYLVSEYTATVNYVRWATSIYSADLGTQTEIRVTQYFAGISQIITGTLVGTSSANQNMIVTFKSKNLYEPYTLVYDIAVLLNDTATVVAGKMVTAFNHYFISEQLNYIASNSNAIINITKIIPDANDAVMTATIKGAGFTDLTLSTVITGVPPSYASSLLPLTCNSIWTSSAYQLNPTGKQALKAIHISYYAPNGTTIKLYTSNTIDQNDFIMSSQLPNSALKQNSKRMIPIKNSMMHNWLRIKFEGIGSIVIYNVTFEWRVLDRVR